MVPTKAGLSVVANASLAKGSNGTITNQTKAEPIAIIVAYLSPTIYPKPKTAAPTFIWNTTLALSASATPDGITRVVNTSAHPPKVATIKS